MEIFLLAIFIMGIANPIIFKICAMELDHRTAPIFVSVFCLAGAAITWPIFGELFHQGFERLLDHPIILALCAVKGGIMWYSKIEFQRLKQASFSSNFFVLPFALSIAALVNFFLGEMLTTKEWIAIIGLSLTSILFFLKGHLSDLEHIHKSVFTRLIGLTVLMLIIDHYVVIHSNWYTFLILSYATVFILCVILFRSKEIWVHALWRRKSLAAGLSFVVYEFVKFYPMVTIVPVSVIGLVDVMRIPILLVLSALIWKERVWQEQLIWGAISAFFLLFLIL